MFVNCFSSVSPPGCGSHVLTTLLLDTNIHTSPTHMTYPGAHTTSSLQQTSPASMSRLQTSSTTFPPGLDLRNQYRNMPNQNNSSHATTPRSSSYANAFTGGYASAPLTAPVDFSLPRTPIDGNHRDFSIPQLSAPMAPPQDFSSAYNSSISASRPAQNDQSYSSQVQGSQSTGEGQGSIQALDNQNNVNGVRHNSNDNSYLRPVEYETGEKRKRSFNLTGGFESP